MAATPDSTLANPERLIADLQRQLAEREAELDDRQAECNEALQREAATAEVLQVINSSPGDLAPVFDAMLEKAMRLCGAAFGMMLIVESEHIRTIAHHGVPAAFAEFIAGAGSYRAAEGSIAARLLGGEPFVHIVDLMDDDLYRRGDRGRHALVDLGRARTSLAVPLLRDQDVQGLIMIYRQERQPFSDKQIALLQNFAAQAVIAMENARLITETREALEQQTATSEVLQVINSSPGDLKPVFEAVLEKAVRLSEAVYGHLWRYDGEYFHPWASHGGDQRFAQWFAQRGPRRPNPDGDGFLGRVVRGERVLYMADIRESQAYRAGNADNTSSIALADLGGGRSVLTIALRKDDAVLDAMTVYRREVRPFTDKQITLLQNFAAQAVIAMENARLLGELRQRTDEVAELNRGLEARVAAQVDELGRVGRLKRFLAPQLAELIVSHGDEKILESHRREIVVVFCDLRGYTAFTETAEPEEVLDFLREYHGALGPLVSQFEGTLDQFSGDGIMVFFNDPVPCLDPAERAVRMAIAMREAAGTLIAAWRERGRELGFGAGIAQGYATLGQIGFSERSGYTAIGTVCNVAARLCAEAKDGQILLSQRVNVALKGSVATEQVGALALKGLTQPVVAFNVPLVGSQAAFRVIEGGAPDA